MPGIPRPQRVSPYRLSRLCEELPQISGDVSASPELSVTGASLASGKVEAGDLYIALPGSRRHGAEFLTEATRRGAVAVLTDTAGATIATDHQLPILRCEDPRALAGEVASLIYGEPTRRLSVTGITGTNGKTSTAYLVESGLRAAGRRTGLIGTVETRVGDETIVSERTTPEAPELQALFAYAAENGVTDVVMEVSSHALALHRADGIHFAVGGFTMFGLDHLDFHIDVDDYFTAKSRLFDGRCDSEVINADDAWAARLITAKTVTYSLVDATADWSVGPVAGTGFDQSYQVTGPGGAYDGAVRLPGRHNVANALLAYACLVAVGVPPETAVAGVARCPGVPGRMELVSGDGPVRGVVDYAHKPDAVTAVLAALRQITDGRLIAIIGAGGDRDTSKRPVMGRAAAAEADLVVVTDDNPRTEDPGKIRAEVLAGVGEHAHHEVGDRAAAVAEAAAVAQPGDTIALLGKGHEPGQELAGRIVDFDDRRVLAAALHNTTQR